MALEIVSYADLKSLLELTGATVASYPTLSLLITSVESAIESYLKRELESKERTEVIFVNSKTKLIKLKALPIESISSVTVTEYFGDTIETLDSTDYFATDFGISLLSSVQKSKVTVIYTGGYETATLPSQINRAALYQVGYEFQSKDEIGASMVSNDGGMISRPELGLLKEVKRVLNPFIHPLAW